MTESIEFAKMSGCGNDFILVDHRDGQIPAAEQPAFARAVCRRKLSIGADGLILIENWDEGDFKWHFYNSDGSRAEMCGNGARCAARFAFTKEICGPQMTFLTDAGPIAATVEKDLVRIALTPPGALDEAVDLQVADRAMTVATINTGVPHAVCFVDAVEQQDVVGVGRALRRHSYFAPSGTNVNFVSRIDGQKLAIRTYERGVEDETLACGTGAVAAALAASRRFGLKSPVSLQTMGGGLSVYYEENEGRFESLQLQGDARLIYFGRMQADALTAMEN